MGILIKFARQWIAGEHLKDAVRIVKHLDEFGIDAIMNNAGEHYTKTSEVTKEVAEYFKILDAIKENGLMASASVSVKPTQLTILKDGKFNSGLFYESLGKILEKAREQDTLVWIDMENIYLTQETLDAYNHFYNLRGYKNLGIVIQAYLRRTESDLRKLSEMGAKIRLCKGAYNEDENISIKDKKAINRAYKKHLEFLFKKGKAKLIAAATHDDELIAKAKELHKKYPKVNFEFQMLMGIRNKLQENLVEDGYNVSAYVIYGKNWLPYMFRRVWEKKDHIWVAIRSMYDNN